MLNYKTNAISFVVWGVLWLLSIHSILWDFGQSDFYQFFPWLTLSFGVYMLLIYKDFPLYWVITLGLVGRLLTLGVFPTLSDDIYRFFWDGCLVLSGHSPYGVLPIDALNLGVESVNEAALSKLNSPDYYTVYPPVSQLYFALSSLLGDVTYAAFILKILFLLTEITGLYFIIKLLKKLNMPLRHLSVVWLSPLILLESYGNVHFELVMCVFLLIAFYAFLRQKMMLSGLFLALSIGVKLLPLMLLPWFLIQSIKEKKWTFPLSFFVFSLFIFLPVLLSFQGVSLLQSLDLYFRKFEFNASIYYLLRYLGQIISGYNLIAYIGPFLGGLAVIIILKIALMPVFSQVKYFGYVALLSWTVYLLTTTTVHPWYIIVPLGLSMFTSWRYPVLWSYVGMWSYSHYAPGNGVGENYSWIIAAYTMLFIFMGYEVRGLLKGKFRILE